MKVFQRKNVPMLLVVLLLLTMLAGCGGQKTSEKASEEASNEATEEMAAADTTEEVIEPVQPEGNHDTDVEILQRIIEEQNALGAEMPTDLNDGEYPTYAGDDADENYYWNENGRLIGLRLGNMDLQGEVSFAGLGALEELLCYDNQISSLDVSGCTALEQLLCYDNQISSLNVSGCTALEILFCYDNQISSLDVSNNIALRMLHCRYNQLTSLDVTNCTQLGNLYYDYDKVTVTGYSK